jgi:valyl-tRNA synthetase
MFAPWPKALGSDFRAHYGVDECYLEIVDGKFDLVSQGRNLRREANIPAGKKVRYVFKPAGAWPPLEAEVLKLLLNAEALEIDPNYQPAKGTPTVHSDLGDLYLPLEGLIDVAAEKARLQKELEKVEADIAKARDRLGNPAFTQKAPAEVLAEHQKRLADLEAKQARLAAALEALG